MPVKAVPVEVETEAVEVAEKEKEVEEIKEESKEIKEESKEEVKEEVKKKRRTKEEIIQAKAEKEKAKAAKEKEKIDMKTRVQCPICRATMSQWNLTYKHKCKKEDLDVLPKAPTFEEKFPEEKPEKPEPKKKKKVVEIISSESEEEIPSPPVLQREPPRMSYREILLSRQYEMQKQRAAREVGAIRKFFGRHAGFPQY